MSILVGELPLGKMPVVTIAELEHWKRELETIDLLIVDIRMSMEGGRGDQKHVEEQLAALAWCQKRRDRIGRRIRHAWLWEDCQKWMEERG